MFSQNSNPLIVLVLTLLLIPLSPEKSHAEDSPPGCPTLSGQTTTNKVVVYVGRATDDPNAVCTQVVNGRNEIVIHGAVATWLYKWEKKLKRYRPINEPDIQAVTLLAYILPVGGSFYRRLPYSRQSLSPGRYKACFRFSLAGQARGEGKVRGSKKFFLP